MQCWLDHGQWQRYGRDDMHSMCSWAVLDGIGRGCMYGMRGWLDHKQWHQCRCDGMRGMRGGQVLERIERGIVHRLRGQQVSELVEADELCRLREVPGRHKAGV